MSKWSEQVDIATRTDIGRVGTQCTGFIQTLIYRAYGEWCTCQGTKFPIDWLEHKESREKIEKHFEIIIDVKQAKKYDIGVYRTYNVFGHSVIFLEDYKEPNFRGLSSNQGGDETVRIWEHHSSGLTFILRPKEHLKPLIGFELIQSKRTRQIVCVGWALDPKNKDVSIPVHAFLKHENQYEFIGDCLANLERTDVGKHGFVMSIDTAFIGNQEIILAAIDSINPQEVHTWSESKKINIIDRYKVGDRVKVSQAYARIDDHKLQQELIYGKTYDATIIANVSDNKARPDLMHPICVKFDDGCIRFTNEEFIELI